MQSFVNLHSHTCGSHLDAIIRVSDLFKRVGELGQTAISITDHGNMSSLYSAYREYKKYKDTDKPIKMIPGNEIYFCEDLGDRKAKRRHLVLLAANAKGYKNLLRITAAGFYNSVTVMGRQYPRVNEAILRQYSEGLFATSACGGSLLAAGIWEGSREKALGAAELFRDIYGDRFFIELQPHNLHRGDFSQQYLNEQLKSIAEELNIEMVATCDSHYLTAEHEKYHDMVLAISDKKALDDTTRHRYASFDPCIVCAGEGVYPPESEQVCHGCMGTKGHFKLCAEFYLKSEQEVFAYFAKNFDAEVAKRLVDNTARIAASCEWPDYMEPTDYRLPTFPWWDEPDAKEFEHWKAERPSLSELNDDAAYMRYKVWKSFGKYVAKKKMDSKTVAEYWERLLSEFDILESKDFSSYMLIVSDYVNWAKNNGIPVGPGRGSVGGSLVAFMLNIHKADSIEFGLLFERFQSKLRPSPPDIDLDFAPSGRERVIDYCRNKYGPEKMAYISNILKLTPKLVIKDVARSLQIGGDKSSAFKIANEVTADIPDTITINGKAVKVDTMERALLASVKLRKFIKNYPEVLDYANHLIGLPKTFSTHAAGVIIADIPLDEYVPLRRDNAGNISVQFDKNACEYFKLVKMDFLALETLDVLGETYRIAQELGINLPDPDNIPDGDNHAYKLIQTGNVAGVFQLSGSLAPLCKAFKPQSIKDIALVNALGRPSCSQEERRLFIQRRFGRSKVQYKHPSLEPVLAHTYGISVFDDDLLKLAQHLAGWDLSAADGLRKMTKDKEKGEELQDRLCKSFVADAAKHYGLTTKEASEIWEEVILPFANYGFPASHAILYSMLSYQTAFYKVYAPGAFFCALLNAETRANRRERQETIDGFKRDAKRFGVSIEPCDINFSKQYYTMKDKKTIVMGLGAVKGVGDKALNAIIEHQPYTSFEDFLHRTPSTTVNKSVIIALAKAGAFDSLRISRKFASERYSELRKALLAHVRKLDDSFFENGDPGRPLPGYLSDFTSKFEEEKESEWTQRERLSNEKEVLGEYISGTAEDIFPGFFKGGLYSQSFGKIAKLPEGTNFAMEGLIVSIKEIIIKKPGRNQGKTMAKFLVENLRGETIEVTIWADTYNKFKRLFKSGVPLRGLFKVNEFNGSKSLILLNLEGVYKEPQ